MDGGDRRPRGLWSPAKALPTSVAFYVLVSLLASFAASSVAPTPLWVHYQQEWHFSAITVTTIYCIYVVPLLGALLTVGRLSDHVGRRPVVLSGVLFQCVAMVLFTTADSVSGLVVARVVQGFGMGTVLSALGAGFLDLDRRRGTIANGTAALAGIGVGGLVASVTVEFLPAPTKLVYLIFLVIFVAEAVGVVFMRESSPLAPGAFASLTPQIALPKSTRAAFFVTMPIVIAVWALLGFYASLGPELVQLLAGTSSAIFGGLAIFVLSVTGSLTVLFVGRVAPRALMVLGAVSLIVGVSVALVGIDVISAPLFFLGTPIAGIGFGAGYQGALRTVLPMADARDRAGILSLINVVVYLGLGLPVVIAGVRAVHGGGILGTAREYAVAVIILGSLALVGSLSTSAQGGEPEGESIMTDDAMARAGCAP